MNERLHIPLDRTQLVAALAGCLLLIYGSYGQLLIRPIVAWVGLIFFGATSVVAAWSLVSKRVGIVLDPQGLHMSVPWKTTTIRWVDIAGFREGWTGPQKVIVIDFKPGYERLKVRRRISSMVSKHEAGIVDRYALSHASMLQHLRAWHSRYGEHGANEETR